MLAITSVDDPKSDISKSFSACASGVVVLLPNARFLPAFYVERGSFTSRTFGLAALRLERRMVSQAKITLLALVSSISVVYAQSSPSGAPAALPGSLPSYIKDCIASTGRCENTYVSVIQLT